MIDRRSLLQAGLAMPMLAIQGRAHAAPPMTAEVPVLRPSIVLFEARLAPAVELARRTTAEGIEALALADDLLVPWHDCLRPCLEQARQAVLAGITSEDGYFLLRTLAADLGLRPVFSARHVSAPGGRLRHELRGSLASVASASEALRSADWRTGFGAVLGRGVQRGRQVNRSAWSAGVERIAAPDAPLVSWLLARRG